MTDQKKPEGVADEYLETAQGGFGSWSEAVGTLKKDEPKSFSSTEPQGWDNVKNVK